MSLLFNMLSRLVIAFLPRSKRLLISWLQSPSVLILEPPPPKKIQSLTVFAISPSICHEVLGPRCQLDSEFPAALWIRQEVRCLKTYSPLSFGKFCMFFILSIFQDTFRYLTVVPSVRPSLSPETLPPASTVKRIERIQT